MRVPARTNSASCSDSQSPFPHAERSGRIAPPPPSSVSQHHALQAHFWSRARSRCGKLIRMAPLSRVATRARQCGGSTALGLENSEDICICGRLLPSCNSPPCAACACRRVRPDGRFSPARDFQCEIGLTMEGEGAYKRGHGAPPPRCDGVPLKLPQRCFGGKCTRNQSGAEGSVAYLYRLGDIVPRAL